MNPLTSADIARVRLFGIVEADREAVPCGRWVKYPRVWGWWWTPMPYLLNADQARLWRRQQLRKLGHCYRWMVRR